jgi:hypothetical protein
VQNRFAAVQNRSAGRQNLSAAVQNGLAATNQFRKAANQFCRAAKSFCGAAKRVRDPRRSADGLPSHPRRLPLIRRILYDFPGNNSQQGEF